MYCRICRIYACRSRGCADGEKWRACSHDLIPERRLSAQQRNRASAVPRARGAATHLRLPHSSQRSRHRRRSPLQQSARDLAGRRPLQVAGHACLRSKAERFCTGDATCRTKSSWHGRGPCPHTLRNPLYHWTHLELQRYFGISELLNVQSAPAIWKRANAVLQDGLTVRAISEEVQRQGRLHHRRSRRRSQRPSHARGSRSRSSRLPSTTEVRRRGSARPSAPIGRFASTSRRYFCPG